VGLRSLARSRFKVSGCCDNPVGSSFPRGSSHPRDPASSRGRDGVNKAINRHGRTAPPGSRSGSTKAGPSPRPRVISLPSRPWPSDPARLPIRSSSGPVSSPTRGFIIPNGPPGSSAVTGGQRSTASPCGGCGSQGPLAGPRSPAKSVTAPPPAADPTRPPPAGDPFPGLPAPPAAGQGGVFNGRSAGSR